MLGTTRVGSGGSGLEKVVFAYPVTHKSETYTDTRNITLTSDIACIIKECDGKYTIEYVRNNKANDFYTVNFSNTTMKIQPILLHATNAKVKILDGLYENIESINCKIGKTLKQGSSMFEWFNKISNGGKRIKVDIDVPNGVDAMQRLMENMTTANGVVNIYANSNWYSGMFENVGAYDEKGIVVNYSANCTNIDKIIATKENGKVVKGTLV